MSTKILYGLAVAGALFSTVGFLRADLAWLAVLQLLCAMGLAAGLVLEKSRLTGSVGLLLTIQTLILGAVWPSAITIVALLVAPSCFFSTRLLLTKSSSARTLVYVALCTFLAAWSLAAEAWLLATVPTA